MKPAIKYWRSALESSDFYRPSDASRLKAMVVYTDDIKKGFLDRKKAANFFRDSSAIGRVTTTVFPFGYKRTAEPGAVRDGMPLFFLPIGTYLEVTDAGSIEVSRRQPFVQGDLLYEDNADPQANGRPGLIKQSDYDEYLRSNPWKGANAAELVEYVRDMAKVLLKDFFTSNPGYIEVSESHLVSSRRSMNKRLEFAYDQIEAAVDAGLPIPLFSNLASADRPSPKQVLTDNELMAKRAGHMSPVFGLADSQRQALTNFMSSEPGEIVALNGPPGTGKTTLLQSVVASTWVLAAINKDPLPPKIVACSTNNQAVTNILESFASIKEDENNKLAGRWIPGLSAYGTYLKDEESDEFFTLDSMAAIEGQDQNFVSSFFLSKFRSAFNAPEQTTVAEAVAQLHSALVRGASLLNGIEYKTQAYATAASRLRDFEKLLPDIKDIDQHLRNQISVLESRIEDFSLAVPIWQRLLRENTANAVVLRQEFSKIIEENGFTELNEMSKDPAGWTSALDAFNICRDICEKSVADFKKLQVSYTDAANKEKESRLDLIGVGKKLGVADAENISIDRLDLFADSKIRQPLFKLAAHYWEGRWIQEMSATVWAGIPDKAYYGVPVSAKELDKIFTRRAMLTPCMVSTFHSLPKHLSFKNRVEHGLALNFADVLIVDEAGQVTPEVGAVGFALAKRALVVGDTKQIEPVWSVSKEHDFYLAVEAGLIDIDGDDRVERVEKLRKAGISVSSGSIMKLAQKSSQRDADAELGPGLHLYEHRRGYDSIIAFCNELCYKGKLIPMRGEPSTPEEGMPPVFGYCQIPGVSKSGLNGSRFNEMEAKIVGSWIANNTSVLVQKYKVGIDRIVGVVTPYKAQSDLLRSEIKRCASENLESIRQAYQACGLNPEQIQSDFAALTCGTVHSLQGAERPVVLLSPVSTRHDKSKNLFIDSSPSLLNVGVSRTKDSFLVFGDVEHLRSMEGKPSGALAKYLYKLGNRLEVSANDLLREDLAKTNCKSPPEFINTLDGHRAALRKSFDLAQKEIMIVSPWVTKSALESDGILASIKSACERGVKVNLYVTEDMNLESSGEEVFSGVLTQLRESGAAVSLVNNMHQKVVYIDDDTMISGSFNWLSSSRSEKFKLMEKSIIYHSERVRDEKELDLEVLSSLAADDQRLTSAIAPTPTPNLSAA